MLELNESQKSKCVNYTPETRNFVVNLAATFTSFEIANINS